MTNPIVELYLGGVWTDITAYTASVRSQLQITRGRQDGQNKATASRCVFALNNRDGRFSPRNPVGAYYGQIGRNTPCRVSVAGKGYRFWGEISEWPPTWDESGQDAWTTVTASGIIRRLGQGAPPLNDPVQRFVASPTISPTVFGYWPMTDPNGSSSLGSGLAVGNRMTMEGASLPRLAASTDFGSSDPVPVLNSGTFSAVPNPYSGPTYMEFLLSVPAAGDTNDAVLARALTTGTAFRWEIRYFTTGLVLRAFDNIGTSLLTSATTADVDGIPLVIRWGFGQSGPNISWILTAYRYDTGAAVATLSGAFAGTAGVVNLMQFNSDRALVNTAVGQSALFNADPFPSVLSAYRGYGGETAGRRIERLCAEEGITFVAVGDLDNTELMGPQTAGDLLDLLGECEATDLGQLYEPRAAFGLAYRTRESLYAQAVDLALTYSQITGIQPVEDDQQTRNDVTVTRRGGSSARSVLATGPLSVLPPPSGVGRYQEAVTLNIYSDDRLQAQADWRVAVGTIDEPRYPEISTEAQNTATTAYVPDVGDLLAVTGTPIWVPPGGVRAQILGYTETFQPHGWDLTFTCQPATPADDAFTLNSATLGRLDSDTSVTSGALTTTATAVPYTGGAWVTTAAYPADFPFDVMIGGEQMRVTAGVAGSLTVTRSINGVVKTHASGAPIRLFQPGRIVL